MYEKKLEAAARLLEVMDTLREKCPWDREQTFHSLRNNTIEECFELVDAITDENFDGIREELGDVLLHIVFYSKMGEEQGRFDFADVCNYLCDKLIYRHPHVYGDVQAEGAQEVIHNWEMLKLKEKAKKERKAAGGVLAGVPRSLPAMVKGYRIGQKAASAGFDWEQKEDVWDKVREEIGEVEAEVRNGNQEHQIFPDQQNHRHADPADPELGNRIPCAVRKIPEAGRQKHQRDHCQILHDGHADHDPGR